VVAVLLGPIDPNDFTKVILGYSNMKGDYTSKSDSKSRWQKWYLFHV